MNVEQRLTAIRDLVQEDVGNRGLARDPAANLINACPDDFAAACRSVATAERPSVVILTGFYIAHAEPPCGETDGPLGALFLVRALVPLGVCVTIITDPFCRQALETGLGACGFDAPAVPVLTIPPETHPWDAWMKQDWTHLIEYVDLTHLIALERVGPSHADGCCYSMRGLDVTPYTNPAHLLVEDAARRQPRITTIGIGDGGNEIGMGKVPWDVVRRNVPNGGQIACRVATDHLIVAGVSNWGAYGLAAGVALLRGQRLDPALFDPEGERELLRLMVEKGPLVDGARGTPSVSVDGLDFDDYAKPLRRLAELVGD
jgi:hypothetical protein